MKYEIRYAIDNELIKACDTLAYARAAAEHYNLQDDPVIVVAHETSGSYESWRQVWPVIGETYTN